MAREWNLHVADVGGNLSGMTKALALATFLQSMLYLIDDRKSFWFVLNSATIALQPLISTTSWLCFGKYNTFVKSFISFSFLAILWNPGFFPIPNTLDVESHLMDAWMNNRSLQNVSPWGPWYLIVPYPSGNRVKCSLVEQQEEEIGVIFNGDGGLKSRLCYGSFCDIIIGIVFLPGSLCSHSAANVSWWSEYSPACLPHLTRIHPFSNKWCRSCNVHFLRILISTSMLMSTVFYAWPSPITMKYSSGFDRVFDCESCLVICNWTVVASLHPFSAVLKRSPIHNIVICHCGRLFDSIVRFAWSRVTFRFRK